MFVTRFIPGLTVVFVIAAFSTALSLLHASFDPLVISIIIGIVWGNLSRRTERYDAGMEAALKVILPIGIALYGTQLGVADLEWLDVIRTLLVFGTMFAMTFFLSTTFGLNRTLGILLASGLSVCGASAIAVISPLINARREDTSIAIISVMLVGLTGMIYYPFVSDFLAIQPDEYVFLTGTTLPMLGQVKVAAASAGPAALAAAVNIKLMRIAMLLVLVPASIALSDSGGARLRVPLFVLIFIAFAFFVNVSGMLDPFLGHFKLASSFFLSSALAAIGCSVNLEDIINKGIRPLGLLFLAWGAVVLFAIILRNLL